jgi:hypothetical protein
VAPHERFELVARHGHRPAAFAHADVAEHLLEAGRRDRPDEVHVLAPRVLDAVPDPAAHEDRRARPQRHAAVLEDRGTPARVHEDDLVLTLVQVHGNRRARPEPLVAHREQRRARRLAIHLDGHVAAARRRPQAQRFSIARSEYEPRWFHPLPPQEAFRMAAPAKHLFVVMMDVAPEVEAAFNDVYDNEHIPALLKVPGVRSAVRYRTDTPGVPRYAAVYEMDRADIPDGDAFKQTADSGAWPHTIRPHTFNRKHIMYTRVGA